MARRRRIEDSQIIDATRRLIQDRGLQISTRAIASEIGISEGVLFQRFRSKEELIRSALTVAQVDAAQVLAGAATGENARETLENIAVAIFAAFRRLLPHYVPLIAQPGFPMDRALSSRTSPFMMFLAALENHLIAERHAGRIWTESPYRTSYFIVSALHNAALFEALAGPVSDISEGTARDLIDTLWSGLEPRMERRI